MLSSTSRHYLKDILQRKLNLPHARPGSRNRPERIRREHIRVRIRPVRMVRRIKALEPELQILRFRNMEILDRRAVKVKQTRTNHRVASHIAKRARCLRYE